MQMISHPSSISRSRFTFTDDGSEDSRELQLNEHGAVVDYIEEQRNALGVVDLVAESKSSGISPRCN